ncbi:hypothetical protein ABK040_005954 [Willaertia magna]
MIIEEHNIRIFQFVAAIIFLCVGLIECIEDVLFTVDASDLFPKFHAIHWASVILNYCFTGSTLLCGIVGITSVFISDIKDPKYKLTSFICWIVTMVLSLALALANAGIVIYLINLTNQIKDLSFHLSFIFTLTFQGCFCIFCVIILSVVMFIELPLMCSIAKVKSKEYQVMVNVE